MFGLNVKVTKLTAINAELASFKCEDSLSGIAHVQKDGTTTAILDGGYVLGVFCCPIHAMDGIHSVANKISQADKAFGMTYENYKTIFMSGLNSTKH